MVKFRKEKKKNESALIKSSNLLAIWSTEYCTDSELTSSIYLKRSGYYASLHPTTNFTALWLKIHSYLMQSHKKRDPLLWSCSRHSADVVQSQGFGPYQTEVQMLPNNWQQYPGLLLWFRVSSDKHTAKCFRVQIYTISTVKMIKREQTSIITFSMSNIKYEFCEIHLLKHASFKTKPIYINISIIHTLWQF